MIALNEILTKKDLYEFKYKLMGKYFNLDKIVKLEKEFIVLDKKSNELRATCNKLCSEVADLVNSNKDTNEAISKINNLDNEILRLDKKSKSAMKKINKQLKKLPNLPLEENVLNVTLKTKNQSCTPDEFIEKISKELKTESSSKSFKKYIDSLKKNVLKVENMPKLIQTKTNLKLKKEIILLCADNALEIFADIQQQLSDCAQHLVIKSIKNLNKNCSKELLAILSDNSLISVEFLGEYVSRENSIKYYDKNLDMTKFVNIIKIIVRK